MMSIQDLYQLFLNSSGVSTDSRSVAEGSIFFALKGANFDGNKFAQQTLGKGAAYAVVDDSSLEKEDRLILVEDVLSTLQSLANHHRKQFQVPFIGITGSNGKTTTKELLAAILSKYYRTHFTKGNFNNHIGVPLTLLNMPKEAEIAIIEMGANHIGEIASLCKIVEPTHGVITNIGKAHLEGFGSLEGIKKGKSELYHSLGENGVAFVNLDEPYLNDLAGKVSRKVFYQESENPDPKKIFLETKLLSINPVIKIAFLSDQRDTLVHVQSHLFGKYNFNNIQTAISIGRYFKVPSDKIKEAVESYAPSNNRSQLLNKGTNIYVLDAYNANPTSMQNALNNLEEMESEHKMIILGDMLELGAYSQSEHQEILDLALTKSFDQLILVGKEFKRVISEDMNLLHFDDVDDLKKWFNQQSIEDTLILLKGSRGIRLESLLNEK